MTIDEMLHGAQFVVNEKGERTAVFLPVEAWEKLVAWMRAQQPEAAPPPVNSLEALWGDFWPEDAPVDEFIDTVRQWRQDDPALHRELS